MPKDVKLIGIYKRLKVAPLMIVGVILLSGGGCGSSAVIAKEAQYNTVDTGAKPGTSSVSHVTPVEEDAHPKQPAFPLSLMVNLKFMDATEATLEPLLRELWDGPIEKRDSVWDLSTSNFLLTVDFSLQSAPPRQVYNIFVELPLMTREEYADTVNQLRDATGLEPATSSGKNFIFHYFHYSEDVSMRVSYSWIQGQETKAYPIRINLTNLFLDPHEENEGGD
jgi:hypothetical protein